MNHYLDIRLLPDPEFAATILMSALFSKLHRGLAEIGTGRVGVSFPEVEQSACGLGERLRLHGEAGDLSQLMALPWLAGMHDHVRAGAARETPHAMSYRVVRRVQAKSSPERLRRRMMKRKGINAEEARLVIPDHAAQRLLLPYVTLTSRSTGQRLLLFIEHGPILETPLSGLFTSYGLSRSDRIATVPWF